MTTETNTASTMQKPTPYQGRYRAELEDDDANDEAATQNGQNPQGDTSDAGPENPEERVYKKRYDELKAHHDRSITALRRELGDVKKQLNTTATNNMKMPKTREELEAWKAEFPDLFAILQTISYNTADARVKDVEERAAALTQAQIDVIRERTKNKILQTHPDFDELAQTSEFHDWLGVQPKAIQDWIYANYDDAGLAIRVLNDYKRETGIGPKSTKTRAEMAREAAMGANKGGSRQEAPGQKNKKTYTVSEIARMSPDDYEKYEEDIDLARAEGRILPG